jgi:hypothetical protein
VASGPLLVRGGRGYTGQTPQPILARARGYFRIPTRFPPRRRHSHPRVAAGNRIFRRILFYRVGIRGLLAQTNFRPVKSEYRTLYSRFTGQKIGGLLDMLLPFQHKCLQRHGMEPSILIIFSERHHTHIISQRGSRLHVYNTGHTRRDCKDTE